ncbi:MAG: hypothetical protein FWH05_04185 [Oscillospiraceae bacterium]|nr:hypothetical protein [Oscillospiraceae bacterium]
MRNSNLAYSLDSHALEEKRRQQERHENKIGVTPPKREGNFAVILLLGLLVLTALGILVMSKAEVSITSSKINEKTVLLEKAKSENRRLQSNLDNLYTLTKIEEFATTELGLEKIKDSQVFYPSINVGKLSEVVERKSSDPIVVAEDLFNEAVEYLGFR